MSAVVAAAQAQQNTRKRCTGCGVEKEFTEFYAKGQARGSHRPQNDCVILKSYCKACAIVTVMERRANVRPEPPAPVPALEPLIRASLARTVAQEPHDATGRTRYIRREEDRVERSQPEPAFSAPSQVRRTLPGFDTTPRCLRADHAWSMERLCRGYEILGCDGVGPHIHRKCMIHACETTEQAPTFLLSRRSDHVSVTIRRLTVRSS